jgi:hypothetical protein
MITCVLVVFCFLLVPVRLVDIMIFQLNNRAENS